MITSLRPRGSSMPSMTATLMWYRVSNFPTTLKTPRYTGTNFKSQFIDQWLLMIFKDHYLGCWLFPRSVRPNSNLKFAIHCRRVQELRLLWERNFGQNAYKDALINWQLLDCAESSTSRPLCVSSSTLVNCDRDGKMGEGFERSGVSGPMVPATVFKRGPEGREAVLLWPEYDELVLLIRRTRKINTICLLCKCPFCNCWPLGVGAW